MSHYRYSPKEEKFCVEIATGVDENQRPISQAEAYRRAYNTSKMSEKTVMEKASLMMAKDKIKARVADLREKIAKDAGVDATYVLKRLVAIDQMDVIDIFYDDGSIKPIRE